VFTKDTWSGTQIFQRLITCKAGRVDLLTANFIGSTPDGEDVSLLAREGLS
jgi:hypothetical protein